MTEKLKGIFFDLGNTLISSDDFMNEEALKINVNQFASLGFFYSVNELEHIRREIFRIIDRDYRGNAAVHKSGFFLKMMCDILKVGIDNATIEKFHSEFQAAHVKSTVLLPGTIEVLSFLKSSGHILAIISNGNSRGVNSMVDFHNLRSFFHLVVATEDIKKQKCTTVPFKHTLKELDLEPSEVMMVGDKIDEDVLGANLTGMISVLFNHNGRKSKTHREKELTPQYEINSILELVDIIKFIEKD